MSARNKRRILDCFIAGVSAALLYVAGGWWAVGIGFVFGGWNYYDGMTRGDLPL